MVASEQQRAMATHSRGSGHLLEKRSPADDDASSR